MKKIKLIAIAMLSAGFCLFGGDPSPPCRLVVNGNTLLFSDFHCLIDRVEPSTFAANILGDVKDVATRGSKTVIFIAEVPSPSLQFTLPPGTWDVRLRSASVRNKIHSIDYTYTITIP